MLLHQSSDETRKLWKEDMEFDPILQHRHFCPWVNTNVGRGLCGWQLTLDALEASPSLAKSESASSLYNVCMQREHLYWKMICVGLTIFLCVIGDFFAG